MKKIYKNKSLILILQIVVLFLAVNSCTPKYNVVIQKYESIRVTKENAINPDTSIASYISIYKNKIDAQMNEVIAQSESAIDKNIPEGTLNNLVADIVFNKGKQYYRPANYFKIDICILNHGGLRKGLPKGSITVGNIYELMPFDNKICIITLSGEDTYDLFKFLAEKNEGHPIANCRLIVENKTPTNITINNQPFDKNKTYNIITNDYLSMGNDGMCFFKKALKIVTLDYMIRDLIIEYLKEDGKKGTINPTIDGRYTVK